MVNSPPGSRWLPRPLARRPMGAVLILAATALLWGLGGHGLWESTEARYTEIAAAMTRSGDWIVPRLNGLAHFDKPPLTYWATAAGLTLLGPSEAGARVGLVAAALATLAIVGARTSRLRAPRAAVYAAIALLTAPLFHALSKSVTADLYLTLFVVAAIEAGRRGSRPEAPRAWRWAAWAAAGAAFLTKGPVALLWLAAPAVAWAAWSGRWRRLLRLADPVGVGLAAAIALPWYLWAAAETPGLAGWWLGVQTAGRMAAPYAGERDPVWAYLPVLAWGAALWAVPAALELCRGERDGERRFLAAWILVPLAAFSLFPTKRPNYLLPLLPAVAMAAGAWWADAEAGGRGPAPIRALALAAGALGVALVAAALAVDGLPPPLPALGLLAGPAFLLGAAAAWRAAGAGRLDLAFAGLAVPLLGLEVAAFAALSRPAVESWVKISRPLAVAAAAHRTAGEPVVAAFDWPRAFPFYLGERLPTVAAGERDRTFEPDSAWREWILPEEALADFAGRRALFYVPRSERARLEAGLGGPVTVLAETRRHLLATHRPTPEEAAATSPPPAGRARSARSAP